MTAGALEPLTAACENCDGAKEAVTWCPAWRLWLCFSCRARRTDSELRMPAVLSPWTGPPRPAELHL